MPVHGPDGRRALQLETCIIIIIIIAIIIIIIIIIIVIIVIIIVIIIIVRRRRRLTCMFVVVLHVEVEVGGRGVQLGVVTLELLKPVSDGAEHELRLGQLGLYEGVGGGLAVVLVLVLLELAPLRSDRRLPGGLVVDLNQESSV